MKTKTLAQLIATLAIVSSLISVARADDEAERYALRVMRTNYMEAVNSGNLSRLAPNLAKDVTGVMVTGEEVKGLDGLEAYWKKIQDLIGPGGSYHVVVNADKTDFFNDVAISRGNTEDTVRLPGGRELKFSSYWTAICHKEDGVWKVFRMEAAMDPVNNVFVSLKEGKAKLTYGIGGVVVGVLLMLSLSRLLPRRSPADEKAHRGLQQ